MQHFVFTKTPTKKCSSSLIAKIHFTWLCNFFLLWVLFRNSQLEFIEILSKNKLLKLLPSWVGDLACQVSAHENSHNRVTGHAAERGRSGWKSRQALYHFKHQDRNTGELSPAATGVSPWVLGTGTPLPGAPLGAARQGFAERCTGPFLPGTWGTAARLSPLPAPAWHGCLQRARCWPCTPTAPLV